MRNPDRYTWFGIEKPLPWTLLAWPVLWLYGTVRERIYIRRLTGRWRGQIVPSTNVGTIRLWDKDFNLLASWGTDENVYVVLDDENGRRSGPVTEVLFANDDTIEGTDLQLGLEQFARGERHSSDWLFEIDPGPPIPMSEFYLGRRYGPNGWVDQDADLPQAGSAWNWEIKIGDTDYE